MSRTALAFASFFIAGASVGASAQAGHAAAGNAQEGQTVFAHSCVMCHSVQPGVKIVGPSLASVLRGPHAATARTVHETILNGKGKMPAEKDKLSSEQIADLMAYLRTL